MMHNCGFCKKEESLTESFFQVLVLSLHKIFLPLRIWICYYSTVLTLNSLRGAFLGLKESVQPGNSKSSGKLNSFLKEWLLPLTHFPECSLRCTLGNVVQSSCLLAKLFKVNHDCQKHASATLPRILFKMGSGNCSSIPRHAAMPPNYIVNHVVKSMIV